MKLDSVFLINLWPLRPINKASIQDGEPCLQVRIKHAWQLQSRKLLPSVPCTETMVPLRPLFPSWHHVRSWALHYYSALIQGSPTVKGESRHKALSDKCLIHSLHLHFCQTEATPLLRLSACHSWEKHSQYGLWICPSHCDMVCVIGAWSYLHIF